MISVNYLYSYILGNDDTLRGRCIYCTEALSSTMDMLLFISFYSVFFGIVSQQLNRNLIRALFLYAEIKSQIHCNPHPRDLLITRMSDVVTFYQAD